MTGAKLILVWIVCVVLGTAAGYALGWALWKLGFEVIGSAVAIVGAGAGGLFAFLGFLRWSGDRGM